jgi:long-chain fatty acid transport protein
MAVWVTADRNKDSSMKNPSRKRLTAGTCFVLLLAGDAHGSGVTISEQSVRGLGTAFAEAAAAAEDPSTLFYNPAGLNRLSGSQASVGMNLVLPSARFSNEGSTHVTGQPLSGGNGGDAGSALVVPTVYLSHRLNDRLALGLGVFAPFGVRAEYDRAWVGRYHAVKSDLLSLDINPAVAYRLTDRLSVGAGIDVQYLTAELSNAIDFGTIFGALGAPGMTPQGNDGFVTFEGDSWSWGFNLGGLYEISHRTRVGVAYRFAVQHTLSGDADFSGVPSPNPSGRFLDTGISADVTLPDRASVGLSHAFSDNLSVAADVVWTRWSTVDEFRIEFDNPAESDAVITTRWGDTFRYAIGATYTVGPWALRGGAAYEESPVPDAAHATPRVPDSDRIWATAGVGYRISEGLSVDVAYAHLFMEDATIRKTATGEDRFRGALSGTYASDIDIISAELSWAF